MGLELPRALVEAMLDHARQEFPNECCGLLAGRGSRVERLLRGRNADQSPFTYRLDPQEQLQFFKAMDAEGLELLGIYHSHTQSPAYPSRTDVARAFYPDAVYVILSLRSPGAANHEVEVRAFRIKDGAVTEEDLVEV
ncbi:MAG: M67 family metallopeptidase [Armatimonadota bacterium]|nr:M67 family metallopeptidase [Armatimonadota bacterium]MDR7518425.1 M67 family metallopeptidase [Armatimonadota bacterium]MDR7549333.1 M67 family metallopeptidase [Armatimonadota bacterium]